MSTKKEVFVIQILDKYLLYAPLRKVTALVDRTAVRELKAGLGGEKDVHPVVQPLLNNFLDERESFPEVRTGALQNPYFLGLIPTRGCNMGCRYCDFQDEGVDTKTLDLGLTKKAIDGYFDLLQKVGVHNGEIHFFGGEPFYAESVVHFAVEYAKMKASLDGFDIRFETATNGFYPTEKCQWIADNFDSIVLSLDGPEQIQNRYRPTKNQRPTFDTVMRSAKIFSESHLDLSIRVCVTDETVSELVPISRWLCQQIAPSSVCFESLLPSTLSILAGLDPPDPWTFAKSYIEAERVLNANGVEAVHSTTLTEVTHNSFCPVGKDALIITPDGRISACYLLESRWLEKGLDLTIGRITSQQEKTVLDINPERLNQVRNLNVYHKNLCKDCFCRFHCAGGCHVNHDTSMPPGQYDALCVQTRLITAAKLLKDLRQDDLIDSWFTDRSGLETSVWQKSDRLVDWKDL